MKTHRMLVVIIAMLSFAAQGYGATYTAAFRSFSPSQVTYSYSMSPGTHTFLIDGILQHTWAEFYVNGTYIPPSKESSFPFYTDPSFSRTVYASDTIEIIVYNADNLSIWEKHKWTVAESIAPNPNTPSGPSSGLTGQSLSFTTGGSESNLGHTLQYRFDWGDGNISSFGSATQSKSYGSPGTYCHVIPVMSDTAS